MVRSSALFGGFAGEISPVFLAGFDRSGERLIVHVPVGHKMSEVKAWAVRAIAPSKDVRISVRAHKVRKVAYPRSLEHWLKKFDVENVIHDPTMILGRARLLVAAARSCRQSFGNAIHSIVFEPNSRTLYVVVKNNRVASVLQIHEAVARAFASSESISRAAWLPNLQVVSDLPRRKVKIIAVDAKSASLWHRVSRGLRRWRTPGFVALALSSLAVPAAARDSIPAEFAPHINSAQSSRVAVLLSDYGVLAGLSVFTDGQRPGDAGSFALSGLNFYFAEGSEAKSLIQFAQRRRGRPRDPDEVGQVGGPGS